MREKEEERRGDITEEKKGTTICKGGGERSARREGEDWEVEELMVRKDKQKSKKIMRGTRESWGAEQKGVLYRKWGRERKHKRKRIGREERRTGKVGLSQ